MFSKFSQMRHLQRAKTIAEVIFLGLALFALALAVVMITLVDHENALLYALGWSICGGAFTCLMVYGGLELLLSGKESDREPVNDSGPGGLPSSAV